MLYPMKSVPDYSYLFSEVLFINERSDFYMLSRLYIRVKKYIFNPEVIMGIALLIIDVQEAFIGNKRGSQQFEETMFYINQTADLFRKSGNPVFIIRDLSEGNGRQFDNVKELKTSEEDRTITKFKSNSFWDTTLEEDLKGLNIDFTIICGNAAEYCILATYNGSAERGFLSAVLQNGVFSKHEDGLLDLFRNRSLVSYDALEYLLNTLNNRNGDVP